MRKTIAFLLLVFSFYSPLISQEFSSASVNPYHIHPDTTGGKFIYTFNVVDLDQDGDLDVLFPYLGANDFGILMQENVREDEEIKFRGVEDLDIEMDYPEGLFFPVFSDFTQDGKIDIISFGQIDPRTGNAANYYKNISNTSLTFERTPGIDIGLKGIGYGLAIPKIVDINADGDTDLIISGATFSGPEDESDGIFYFAQNSSSSAPDFISWFENPYGFHYTDTMDASVILPGDFDQDGDIDLMSYMQEPVTAEGRFYYYENISPPTDRPDYSGVPMISPFGLPENIPGIPSFDDLDGDGDLDLLVLDANDGVKLLFYENTACVNSSAVEEVSLCSDTYEWNGNTYSSSGSYSQTFANSSGCDSIVTLELALLTDKSEEIDVLLCAGEEMTINGEIFTEGGNYVQNLTASNGCDSILNISVEEMVNDVEVSILEDKLSASGSYETLQWVTCPDFTPVLGATEAEFVPEVSGSYAVNIMNNGCEFMSECVEFVITSSIDISKNFVTFFPNPVYSQMTIRTPGKMKVYIHNLHGQLMDQYELVKGDNVVEVGHLIPGVYILKTNKTGESYRIIKY